MTLAPSTQSSQLLPIYQTFSSDYGQFLIQITKTYSDLALAINDRQTATFTLNETIAGQNFFNTTVSNTAPANPRSAFRKVTSFSPLVTGLNSFPHGITGINANFTFTDIYGTGRNAAGTLQVPFPQGGANTSMLEIDPVNINLTIPVAYNGFSCIIVLEYIRN